MKKALITGISGQDGQYLAELLLSKNYKVYGLIRGQNNPKKDYINKFFPKIEIIEGDLTDSSSLIRALEISQPDEVYNLAAISFVGYSWNHAILTSQVSAFGVLNLLEAIKIWAGNSIHKIKFYQASSSEMFGRVQEVPQKEGTLLWPRSPYGVAKAFGHHITINYRESYGLFACSGILFNHESPRRGEEFVTRKISINVAKIALGMQEKFELGNLNSRRDWGFAGDYVEAMWKMLQLHDADDFVIATGQSHSVEDFLVEAFNEVGIQKWQKHVAVSEKLFRPAEVENLIGDSTKAKKILDWQPKTSFKELVSMMVQSDLKNLTKIKACEH
jgi:GDPmannose 4,6-dehydratase